MSKLSEQFVEELIALKDSTSKSAKPYQYLFQEHLRPSFKKAVKELFDSYKLRVVQNYLEEADMIAISKVIAEELMHEHDKNIVNEAVVTKKKTHDHWGCCVEHDTKRYEREENGTKENQKVNHSKARSTKNKGRSSKRIRT